MQRTQSGVILSVADECVLLDTCDNLHRICSLQKSSIRVLHELSGARGGAQHLSGGLSNECVAAQRKRARMWVIVRSAESLGSCRSEFECRSPAAKASLR